MFTLLGKDHPCCNSVRGNVMAESLQTGQCGGNIFGVFIGLPFTGFDFLNEGEKLHFLYILYGNIQEQVTNTLH